MDGFQHQRMKTEPFYDGEDLYQQFQITAKPQYTLKFIVYRNKQIRKNGGVTKKVMIDSSSNHKQMNYTMD